MSQNNSYKLSKRAEIAFSSMLPTIIGFVVFFIFVGLMVFINIRRYRRFIELYDHIDFIEVHGARFISKNKLKVMTEKELDNYNVVLFRDLRVDTIKTHTIIHIDDPQNTQYYNDATLSSHNIIRPEKAVVVNTNSSSSIKEKNETLTGTSNFVTLSSNDRSKINNIFTQENTTNHPQTNINEHPEVDCSICFDEISGIDQVRKIPCNHIYHKNCLDTWLTTRSTVCPSCRFNLSSTTNSDTNTTPTENI
ncbi:hypothetical protein BB558_006355 [Smittium angustum]|nr:hypothetical protein BB558_006355 [Smittium angustum]